MIRISVVIPTYRRPDLLGRCLSALAAQDLDPQAFEVLVVDDAACDETREQVERAAATLPCPIRYLPVTGRHGPAAARNLGWKAARGNILAFTDDDCVPDRSWLNGQLEADSLRGALVGSLLQPSVYGLSAIPHMTAYPIAGAGPSPLQRERYIA